MKFNRIQIYLHFRKHFRLRLMLTNKLKFVSLKLSLYVKKIKINKAFPFKMKISLELRYTCNES